MNTLTHHTTYAATSALYAVGGLAPAALYITHNGTSLTVLAACLVGGIAASFIARLVFSS